MASPEPFRPVKLFCGFIYSRESWFREARERTVDQFSCPDVESDPIPFDLTTYYQREMGAPLYRRFVAFRELVDPGGLPDVKIATNRIEEDMAAGADRRVNIDPGYLSSGHVIIATTKPYYHRVPLNRGIYAHLEYVIKARRIQPLEWTYPDFLKPDYLKFFRSLHTSYKQQV